MIETNEKDIISYGEKNRYASYLELANIKYDSYLKKVKVIKIFNEKIDKNIENYDKIIEFLGTL